MKNKIYKSFLLMLSISLFLSFHHKSIAGKIHSEKKIYTCPFYQFCNYESLKRAHIYQHIQRYTLPYTCNICIKSSKRFTLTGIREHFIKHHSFCSTKYEDFITCNKQLYEQFTNMKRYTYAGDRPLSLPEESLSALIEESCCLKGRLGARLTRKQKIILQNLLAKFNDYFCSYPQSRPAAGIHNDQENHSNITKNQEDIKLSSSPDEQFLELPAADFFVDQNIPVEWYVNKAIKNFPDIQPLL